MAAGDQEGGKSAKSRQGNREDGGLQEYLLTFKVTYLKDVVSTRVLRERVTRNHCTQSLELNLHYFMVLDGWHGTLYFSGLCVVGEGDHLIAGGESLRRFMNICGSKIRVW